MKTLIRFADYAGMAASALCLVHCLAMPLVLAAFPLLGLGGEHHALHDALLVGVTVPVLLALVPGYLKHRDPAALLLGVAGLVVFLVAVLVLGPRIGELAETVGAVISSVLLLGAHVRNHRHCRVGGSPARAFNSPMN
ncbi:MerC domain-containing protein [Telluria aromaticivorans]|uniref:MerC domain-containing protein n=1 Tax=Telluria aromaticivorans TaxID=2725995 RepID=A0A7Y2P1B8_9BURK|nr:MerC domain-containing protein [Telluria aromaticivorans]NNG25842.1 MerC domain-containing protein [Telluria aromaticivorans]